MLQSLKYVQLLNHPKESLLSNLLLIPLEDSVVFPNMSVTLTVDVGDAERVFLVPVHEGEYARRRHRRRGLGTDAPARRRQPPSP